MLNDRPNERAEFQQGDVESLPLVDETVDVVISNGVFNLCLNKPKVVAEAFRVLRAGGRLLMADMMLEVTSHRARCN